MNVDVNCTIFFILYFPSTKSAFYIYFFLRGEKYVTYRAAAAEKCFIKIESFERTH